MGSFFFLVSGPQEFWGMGLALLHSTLGQCSIITLFVLLYFLFCGLLHYRKVEQRPRSCLI